MAKRRKVRRKPAKKKRRKIVRPTPQKKKRRKVTARKKRYTATRKRVKKKRRVVAKKPAKKKRRPRRPVIEVYQATDSYSGDGDASFDVQDLHGHRIDGLLPEHPLTIRVTVDTYKDGDRTRTKTLTRHNVDPSEFWYTYHDMVREDFESEDGYGEGVVTTGITVS